ncbi:hypothetical protein AGMMS49975_27790 [Clostridia bacterium]|nr:hypothetical protein AGMMS49975_27790 [Clostridia bacterium]
MNFCKNCGNDIIFIRTANGNSMPCDPKPIWVIPRDEGGKFMAQNGKLVTGIRAAAQDERVVVGFVPHFGTCPTINKKSGRKKQASNANEQLRLI